MIEIKSQSPGGSRGWKLTGKGHKGIFWKNESVLYLGWGTGYTHPISQNRTLKVCALLIAC